MRGTRPFQSDNSEFLKKVFGFGTPPQGIMNGTDLIGFDYNMYKHKLESYKYIIECLSSCLSNNNFLMP